MKVCSYCSIEKDLDEFHKNKRSKDGRSNACRNCVSIYGKTQRRVKNNPKVREYYDNPKLRDRKREYQRWRNTKDPRLQLLLSAKSRAKKYKLQFNIGVEDIVIPEFCPLLGIPLFRKPYERKNKTWIPNSPSLDKIIPQLGYVKGNVWIISMKANAMKQNASIGELITFSKNALKIFDNGSNTSNKIVTNNQPDSVTKELGEIE